MASKVDSKVPDFSYVLSCPIDRLPDELLLKIFTHAHASQSLPSLQLTIEMVCRKWKILGDDLPFRKILREEIPFIITCPITYFFDRDHWRVLQGNCYWIKLESLQRHGRLSENWVEHILRKHDRLTSQHEKFLFNNLWFSSLNIVDLLANSQLSSKIKEALLLINNSINTLSSERKNIAKRKDGVYQPSKHFKICLRDPKFEASEIVVLEALRLNLINFENIPKDKCFFSLCLEAVRQAGSALGHVPDEFITEELCFEAVRQDGFALKMVPDKFITEQLYLEAVRKNGLALQEIPHDCRTKEVCVEAYRQNPNALAFVPSPLKQEIYPDAKRLPC